MSIMATSIVTSLGSIAAAQDIDPKNAPSWEFMQQAMPGVPYSLLAAACTEGTLMIYNGTWSDAQKTQIAAFSKRFPCIKVQNRELPTDERRERFLVETRGGRNVADIVQDTDPGILDQQTGDGLLLNYTISNDASFEDSVKKKGYWYPLRILLTANAWNSNNVTDKDAAVLAKWDGILDPKFKGRIGVVLPAVGFPSTLYPFYGVYKLYGEDFMKKFAALKPRNFSNANTLAGALASGDVDVGLVMSETGLIPIQVQGAPVKWFVPEPGLGQPTGQAINAKAPHPNAAKLYQEYAFTTEGYGAWNKLGGAPARIGFKDTRDVAGQDWYVYPKTFFKVDPADMTANAADFVKSINGWFGVNK